MEKAVLEIRELLASANVPAPVNDERCRACSLIELCQREALTALERDSALRAHRFDPEI